MKVLVLNPGATSTKIAVFDEERELFKETIPHKPDELEGFVRVIDQREYRKNLILERLQKAGFDLSDVDAVCGRGGLLKHIPSGTYAVTEAVLRDCEHPPYGEHASNLGALLAKELGDAAGHPSYFVDPVSVDELQDVARLTGYQGMERQSFFHALNQKATARRAAEQLGKSYEEARLIVVHLGGGVSVAAHRNGLAVDVNNVKDEGAFGMDRGGGLPVNALVDLCYSGLSKQEVKSRLGTRGGAYSYVGLKDFRELERRAFEEQDEACRQVFEAMAYQLAKDIGAMAAVLQFRVDAVVYTGGMAYSQRLTQRITEYVGALAPVICLPGEEEMRSLAEGALRVLHGEEAKRYEGGSHEA